MRGVVLAFLILPVVALCANENPTAIPAGAKVYIHQMKGFGTDIAAGFRHRHVPLAIVDDLGQADFEVTDESQSQPRGSREQVTIKVVNRRTRVVALTYALNSSFRRKQSAAERCAKFIATTIRREGFVIDQPAFRTWGPLPPDSGTTQQQNENHLPPVLVSPGPQPFFPKPIPVVVSA